MAGLPNAEKAFVQKSKITEYLLNLEHEIGGTKAAFFLRFGFSLDNWQLLVKSLVHHAATSFVVDTVKTEFGTKYILEGPIQCPDGRMPSIRSVWEIAHGEDVPRFITAHPDRLT
jgi:hypothetical protein